MKKSTYELASKILGRDFISPVEIAKKRNLVYARRLLAACKATLPSEEDLVWCRDNHMLLTAGPPKAMSLTDIRTTRADFFFHTGPDHKNPDWFDDEWDPVEKFHHEDRVRALSWIAFRKEAVKGSFSKEWTEQCVLVKAPMIIPNIAEALWPLTTYRAVRNISPFKKVFVRTCSVNLAGHRVAFGRCDTKGLRISLCFDGYIGEEVGLSAVRKF